MIVFTLNQIIFCGIEKTLNIKFMSAYRYEKFIFYIVMKLQIQTMLLSSHGHGNPKVLFRLPNMNRATSRAESMRMRTCPDFLG